MRASAAPWSSGAETPGLVESASLAATEPEGAEGAEATAADASAPT
eukprot:COSAG06_NODE_290_length_18223_cov_5.866696_1_plen_45_part_10